MEYTNENVRRKDRLLEEENAYSLLIKGEYGVLSMQEEDGIGAYGIPVNFVWDGNEFIYIHCAPEGHKLCCISMNSGVSFCILGSTNLIPNKFTTGYESIILTCHASIGLTPEERMHALELLMQKYSPDDLVIGRKYAEKSFHRTEIIRLKIVKFSGKCKRVMACTSGD